MLNSVTESKTEKIKKIIIKKKPKPKHIQLRKTFTWYSLEPVTFHLHIWHAGCYMYQGQGHGMVTWTVTLVRRDDS